MDHFKAINDTWGHLAGDEVLREAAQRMQRELRVYDVLGRYGGEEFLLAVPDCDPTGLLRVAERLRSLVADTPVVTEGQAIAVTASIGVAWTEGDGTDDSLIREADVSLYEAKRTGRNRVVGGPSLGGLALESA